MAGWEQGLWFVCTFLNLAAFGFWVVYMFEIIQVEVDAIKAQQEVCVCVDTGDAWQLQLARDASTPSASCVGGGGS